MAGSLAKDGVCPRGCVPCRRAGRAWRGVRNGTDRNAHGPGGAGPVNGTPGRDTETCVVRAGLCQG